MAEADGQEKTEQASGKKLTDARERGQVAKSVEITSFAIFTSGLMLIFMSQSGIGNSIGLMTKKIFGTLDSLDINRNNLTEYAIGGFLFFLKVIGPFFGVLVVVGLVANIAQVGFKFSFKSLAPKFSKFNPLSGIKRMFFSGSSLVELFKSLLKLGIIVLFTYNVLDGLITSSMSLADFTIEQIVDFMLDAAYSLIWKIALVYAAIAGVDLIYQRIKFKRNMMMTKQEVKEENKQNEGDPQIKSRIRTAQRAMANKRMMQNIPQADVVITNPTHFAIAIKYDMKKDAAPKVVAKGMDELALKIKEIARKHNVPLHEDRPLARALYKACNVGDQIPATLFKAVAQILAYIFQLRKAKKKKQIV
jgi:flagellar biosynthetic protein FlhB